MRHRRIVLGLLSLGALAAGAGLRLALRPSVADLERQATLAWMERDVPRAESLARQALGRSSSASRAREVLTQVAAHDDRPLLHVAVLLSVPADEPAAPRSRLHAGEAAFQSGFARIAENAWQDAIVLDPRHAPAYDRLIALAAIRLDRERLVELLVQRSSHLPPTAEEIRLLMGGESLESEAATLERSLQSYVENDPGDDESRVGLARCLIVLGRDAQARDLLSQHTLSGQGRVILAQAELALGRLEQALATLPESPPAGAAGEYWLTVGLLALTDGRVDDAIDALGQAVDLRPLNREIRARYCEALRSGGVIESNQRHVDALRILQEIEALARNPSSDWRAPMIDELITRCETIEAPRYSELLRQYRLSL